MRALSASTPGWWSLHFSSNSINACPIGVYRSCSKMASQSSTLSCCGEIWNTLESGKRWSCSQGAHKIRLSAFRAVTSSPHWASSDKCFVSSGKSFLGECAKVQNWFCTSSITIAVVGRAPLVNANSCIKHSIKNT